MHQVSNNDVKGLDLSKKTRQGLDSVLLAVGSTFPRSKICGGKSKVSKQGQANQGIMGLEQKGHLGHKSTERCCQYLWTC